MTVLEGHAEFFSNTIAAKILSGFKIQRRDWLLRWFDKLYGGLPEDPYQTGAKFIEYLYKKGGSSLANLPLEIYPESMEEIKNPEKYIERVRKGKA